MQVFKFGGASVKDAAGIRKVAEILKTHGKDCQVVVLSAMGKTTNALEQVVDAYINQSEDTLSLFQKVKDEHLAVMNELFVEAHPVFDRVENLFVELEWALEDPHVENYAYTYDQIVSMGELFSTEILSAYLNDQGLPAQWKDARDFIKTDNQYRNAKIDWDLSTGLVQQHLSAPGLYVTQGFIGCTSENFNATLGREGSDYTAAIIGACLGAESVSIWKDVPGILNADPRFFDLAVPLKSLPYKEAIELAFYGAKVIHPKTIQPLQQKGIPLYVKSFVDPEVEGTLVCDGVNQVPQLPSYILKQNQTLLSLSSKDLSFIQSQGLSLIFKAFADHDIAINMMQQSAVSFSACFDSAPRKMDALLEGLSQAFKVKYNEGLSLYTLRHYQAEELPEFLVDATLILEQKNRQTIQLLVKH